MGWFDRGSAIVERTESLSAAIREAQPPTAAATAAVPSWEEFRSLSALYALQIPAFSRCLRLISGTVAQLPLIQWRDGNRVPNPLLAQPESARPVWVTIQRTVEDLALHGRAYWRVEFLASGYPSAIRVIPTAEVSRSRDGRSIRWDGEDHPLSQPGGGPARVGSVIEFTGYGEGVLITGVDTIETALALESAARNMAAIPIPHMTLKNDGADLSAEEVKKLLTDWETARKNRATAYLNSVVSMETHGWNSSELQLVEARNLAALQIARLFSLDPMWVGASISGSSLTYTNRVDARKDLIDLTLSDYMQPIEQRLSMHDVTPTVSTNIVRFDTSEFLRANIEARAQLIAAMLPLGVIDVDEAAEILADAPIPRSN